MADDDTTELTGSELDGSRTISGPGAEVKVAWHVRGQDAEATMTVRPRMANLDEKLARAVGHVLTRAVNGLEAHDVRFALAVDHPVSELDPFPELVARLVGLRDKRDLLQLRRPLPVPEDHASRAGAPALAVRPFRPGTDDEGAWIRVNNRAFGDHPEQGHETPETLADRMADPTFDAADFLVADDPDRPGELLGFCWTKVHPRTAADPELGEIYVIGVDPDQQGARLGPALVLAGLDHLAEKGLGTAMLYVDQANSPARALYKKLGFTSNHRRRIYRR
jgi:mycothiol synthase